MLKTKLFSLSHAMKFPLMPGKVTIIGGGVVGTNAAKMAIGLGAQVTILDVSTARLEYLDDIFKGRCQTLFSNAINIENSVTDSDLVVGGVLITGQKAPTLVTKEMISSMKKGSVVVDVAVDQGGCIETCRQLHIRTRLTKLTELYITACLICRELFRELQLMH